MEILSAIIALLIGIAIGYFICKKMSSGGDHGGSPSEKPPQGMISVDAAVNLHETYIGERYELINNAVGGTNRPDFKDTQFVWFSYDRMKSYLRYLDAAEKKNPENPKISGIRIYFGAYNSHPEYAQQQTVFLTPTIETSLEEEYANMKNLPFSIVPKNSHNPLKGTYKVIERLLLDEHNPIERAYMANTSLGNTSTREKSAMSAGKPENGDDETSLSFNLGQLSPPPPRG